MAIYVYHGGDDSDGSSWDKAYKSITNAAVTGASAGSQIYVASDHSESLGASTTLTFSSGKFASPIVAISVNRTSGAYETQDTGGGKVEVASPGYFWAVSGYVRMFGINFIFRAYFQFKTASCGAFIDCRFATGVSPTGDALLVFADNPYTSPSVLFDNCEFDWTSKGANHGAALIGNCGAAPLIIFKRPAFTSGGYTRPAFLLGNVGSGYGGRPKIVIEDADLSWLANNGRLTIEDYAEIVCQRCTLATGTTPSTLFDAIGERGSAQLRNCAIGAISVPPLGLTAFCNYEGTIQELTSRYRTGGAFDGEQANAVSWEMSSSAGCLEAIRWLESPPITRWVSGGSAITITMYVASGGTLNDDDFWVELSGPDNTASPNQTAKGYHYSSKCADFLGTPTALTTDSVSTWNGSGVTTKQKITHTYTPAEAGPVTVRCFLAKPSTTVYVDPKIEVS